MIPNVAINILTKNGNVESVSIEIDKTNPERNASARNLLVTRTSHRDESKI
jgi:hypothetical protein